MLVGVDSLADRVRLVWERLALNGPLGIQTRLLVLAAGLYGGQVGYGIASRRNALPVGLPRQRLAYNYLAAIPVDALLQIRIAVSASTGHAVGLRVFLPQGFILRRVGLGFKLGPHAERLFGSIREQ